VRLSYSGDTVGIGGGSLRLTDAKGKELFRGSFVDFALSKLREGEAYRVEPVGSTILEVASWAHHPGWTTEVNDNRFRGVLEVRRYGGELVVINELPLEQYVRGVAEPLPNDPWEKAKLLAVLSRSYALYYTDPAHRKYPGAPYDGSDNPAEFQRYLGYSYELRGQMPRAAEATAGLVVTYDGEVVKTPYFSRSGGRTRSVAEARWSAADFPFVRSVEDPWSCGLTSKALGTQYSCPEQAAGHGVGVSGAGAAGLALEGQNFRQIIEYFFDGVAVQQVY
jgi:stage II sporulation protein D